MKNTFLVGIFILTSIAFGQKKLTDISLATSPAASVLGVQPSATLTPKSYKALEAAVYSNFSNEEGGLNVPNDFGLEFMPYWFKDHGMSINAYLIPRNLGNQLIRNSSFSLASTQKFMLGDSTATKSVSWGYRTSVFFNTKTYSNAILQDVDKVIEISSIKAAVMNYLWDYYIQSGLKTQHKLLTALKPDLLLFLTTNTSLKLTTAEYDEIFSGIYVKAVNLPLNTGSPFDYFNGVINVIEEQFTGKSLFTTKFEDLKKKIIKKEGFGIDIAYAMLLNFPTNNFEFSVLPRQSVWLAHTYTFNNINNTATFKGTGILRYEWYNKKYYTKYFPDSNIFTNNFDYGFAASIDYNKFSLQLEGTGRKGLSLEEAGVNNEGETLYKKNSDSDFQYIATLSYRLTDQIAFSYQFGSSFKPVFTPGAGTLISLLSLNFGFGGPSTSNVY